MKTPSDDVSRVVCLNGKVAIFNTNGRFSVRRKALMHRKKEVLRNSASSTHAIQLVVSALSPSFSFNLGKSDTIGAKIGRAKGNDGDRAFFQNGVVANNCSICHCKSPSVLVRFDRNPNHTSEQSWITASSDTSRFAGSTKQSVRRAMTSVRSAL